VSFFKNLFSSKKLSSPVDLSVLGADMHSHFIPAIDDGSKSVENSVEMIRHFHNQGYKKVITTPHIMGDFYRNTPENILGGLEKVKHQLKAEGIPIQMEAAAEYYIDYDFEQKLDNEKLLTFGDNFVLVEISYVNEPDNLERILFKMQTSGYKPILAHPERYPFWFGNMQKFESLFSKDILLQLNINSLTGYYSPETKKLAEALIDRQLIRFLGSDCHHMGHVDLMKQVVYSPHLKKLIESGNLLNHTL
jgi:protein-tyrosine phosphatase